MGNIALVILLKGTENNPFAFTESECENPKIYKHLWTCRDIYTWLYMTATVTWLSSNAKLCCKVYPQRALVCIVLPEYWYILLISFDAYIYQQCQRSNSELKCLLCQHRLNGYITLMTPLHHGFEQGLIARPGSQWSKEQQLNQDEVTLKW